MLQQTSADPTPMQSLTPLQLMILANMRRNAAHTRDYRSIGRTIPGIASKLKGFEWVRTGEYIAHKPGRKPRLIKTGQWVDTRLTKQQRMIRRTQRGMHAHA